MSQKALHTYLRDIEEAYRKGNATEHTYRSYFKTLIETAAPHVVATNEPKHIKNCGAPDFIITTQQTPLGYVETKDIGIPLSNVEHTDQMKRYLAGLANLILTDYVEFRWYVTGQHRTTARLAKPSKKGKWVVDADGMEQVYRLMQGFITTQAPTVNNPKELASRMASIAQLIRNAISLSFKSETGAGSLHGQFEGFRQVLLPDLTADQFADMYAQTICYGLFAARVNTSPKTSFRRELAAYDIPKTNPFLRKMFGYIAGPDLDERVVWAVDDLAEVLNRTDMESILRDFGKRTRQEDPVVHFYETFLAEYDPKMREARGVYYTPEPVVSYIVRSVDYLLKKDFDLSDGLADATKITRKTADGKSTIEAHKVQILDPATGTGTFLHSVIDTIYETFRGNKGLWSSYVSQHLLPRIFGFELLMAPYAVAHIKLGLQLKETGYDFKGQERLGVYLTNTLEEGFGEGSRLPFVEWLIEEAAAAASIKQDAPVMVVLGNPPYSGHSANKGTWITDLLHSKGNSYFEVDGKPLGEHNPKYLLDDYVKFIRFAQWRIQQTGYGILAFITNHGYLDNPTFRGMRQSLIQSFDEIYILDLHGNSKKKERAPEGTKDENVFDIQQGVAIGIFVKRQRQTKIGLSALVHHGQLWGPRGVFDKTHLQQLVGGKYHWLSSHDVATTEWQTHEPIAPFYLFKAQDKASVSEYNTYWRVTDIYPVNSTGIKTHRDHFVTDFDLLPLRKRIEDFRDLSIPHEIIIEQYGLQNTRDWKLNASRRILASSPQWESAFIQCLYRPFDIRAYFHHDRIVELPRHEIMDHMLAGSNLGLATTRSVEIGRGWEHILCTNKVIQHHTVSLKETNYLFPMYLYPNIKKDTLFDINEHSTSPGGRHPNLSPAFIVEISQKISMQFISDGRGDLKQDFGPEDIFTYMYAIFHSLVYRMRYSEFLKTDFPRLPLTSNANLFRQLCRLGERLVGLHLMEQFGKAQPNYPEEGNNQVEKIEYRAVKDQPGRVYINKAQYFEGVSSEVWNFHIGGYGGTVCQDNFWAKIRQNSTVRETHSYLFRYTCAGV